MDSFALPGDVENMWRHLEPDELVVTAHQLLFASAIIRQQFPTIDARITARSIDAELVKFVAASMVIRAARNPEGWRSEQRQIDDYATTLTRDGSVAGGGIYLSDTELALLAPPTARTGAFSITPAQPVTTYADLEQVALQRARRSAGWPC